MRCGGFAGASGGAFRRRNRRLQRIVQRRYRVGSLYVVFLGQQHGRWDLNPHHACARVNEEVDTTTSPWVLAVPGYAKIAEVGNYETEKVSLDGLENRGGRALAADIARHFASPTPAKSETDLSQLYASARRDEDRTQALWALASKEGDEAGAFFRRLLAGLPLPEWARDPTCSWLQHAGAADLPRVLRQVRRAPANGT